MLGLREQLGVPLVVHVEDGMSHSRGLHWSRAFSMESEMRREGAWRGRGWAEFHLRVWPSLCAGTHRPISAAVQGPGGLRPGGVDGECRGRGGQGMGMVGLGDSSEDIHSKGGGRTRLLGGCGGQGKCFYFYFFKTGEIPMCLDAENAPERGKLMLEQRRE